MTYRETQVARITGTGGADTLVGKRGRDTIQGLEGDDFIFGNDGTTPGLYGSDRLFGGDGNDTIAISFDTLLASGGRGNDRFLAQGIGFNTGSTTTVDGGSGVDEFDGRINSAGSGSYLFYRETEEGGSFTVGDYLVTNVEVVRGGTLGPSYFFIRNYGKSLTVYGGNEGDHFELSQSFKDKMHGGGGNDRFFVNSGDEAYGESGDDTFYLFSANGKRTIVDGGDGLDTVANFTGTINLASGIADSFGTRHILSSIENVSVSPEFGGATVVGNAGANMLSVSDPTNTVGVHFDGRGGRDSLFGAAGSDTLTGGGGNDFIQGFGGYDTIDGGAGIDTVSYADEAGTLSILLTDGPPMRVLLNGVYTDALSNVENLVGGSGDDTLYGNNSDNVLNGGGGDDFLIGQGGADILYDSEGGDDLLGQNGSDRFVFAGEDLGSHGASNVLATIWDFKFDGDGGLDIIDLSAIDANTLMAGNQAFKFIGNDAFGGVAGQLRWERGSELTYVTADMDGDAISDFWIHLKEFQNLEPTDFKL
jgi:Ca2+-binding RTX toxin-like protein